MRKYFGEFRKMRVKLHCSCFLYGVKIPQVIESENRRYAEENLRSYPVAETGSFPDNKNSGTYGFY